MAIYGSGDDTTRGMKLAERNSDVFACVLFAGTGLFLLKIHSSRRPGTWPYVALGVVVPVVVIVLFVH